MRKSLSLMLSAALTLGSVATSYAAPLAKKAGGQAMNKPVAAAQKAAKNEKGVLRFMKTRQVPQGVNGLHKVQSAIKAQNKVAVNSATSAHRVAASGITLRGAVEFADSWASGGDFAYGMYSVPTVDGGGFEMLGATDKALGIGVDDNNGTFYSTYLETFYGYVIGYGVAAYDTETWDLISDTSLEEMSVIAHAMALDPVSGEIYGTFPDASGSGVTWKKADFEALSATDIAPLDVYLCAVACDDSGQFYGVSSYNEGTDEAPDYKHDLYKIEKETGELTFIAPVTGGYTTVYQIGGCINNQNHTMLITASTDTDGSLWEIDLATGVSTKLVAFADAEEVTSIYIPKPAAADKAPAAPGLEVACENGAMDVQIKLTMPTTLFDGTPAAGQTFSYSVLANGEEVMTGSALAGAEVSENVAISASGFVSFAATASNSEGASPKAKASCYVGKGTPSAPQNVELTWASNMATLTWSAVSTASDGGYINPEDITYTVLDSEGQVLADGLATTTFTKEEKVNPAQYRDVYYSVKAVYDGKSSEAVESNRVGLGVRRPPFAFDMTDPLQFGYHTIFDANEDGKTWNFNGGITRYSYSSDNDADDWLFSPNLFLYKDHAYKITAKVSSSTTFPERIEIKAGYGQANVGSMTATVVPATVIQSSDIVTLEGWLIADRAGMFVIGFHAISDADELHLKLHSYEISAPVAGTLPGAVENPVVTPDPNGALKADISFKAPSKTIVGADLTGDVKVKVLRGETLVGEVTCAAGSDQSVADNDVPEIGTYTYTLVSLSADGQEGLSTSVSAFVGPKTPADIEAVEMTEPTPGTFVLNWPAVTMAADGSELLPANVSYKVFTVTTNAYGQLAVGDEIGVVTEPTFTYNTTPIEQQGYFRLAVQAFNLSEGSEMLALGTVLTGTPYDMPVVYTNMESLDHFLGIGGDGRVQIYTPETLEGIEPCDDSEFFGIQHQYLDQSSYLVTGKINITGEMPVFSFYVYSLTGAGDSEDTNENIVSVIADGEETVLRTVVNNEDGMEGCTWNKVMVPLDAYVGKTIQVKLTGVCKGYAFNLYDNIRVCNNLNHDLSAAISAPATVETGKEFNVNVAVANEGAEDSDSYTVNLYRDGEIVATQTNQYGSASGEKENFTFKQTLGLTDGESAEYKAVVVYEADENPDNNETAAVTVARKLSTLPKVSGLAGERSEQGVSLTWDAIVIGERVPTQVTEDFESGEPFAKEFADWTFVDLDGVTQGGFQNLDIPGVVHGQTTGSFFVFDNADDAFNLSFATTSGTKFLATLYNSDDSQIDDWAISPLLTGDAQTISFQARSYSPEYPEQIEVWYTTSESVNPEDFVKVEAFGTQTVPCNSNRDFTLYTAALPAGAKHFAIRSCAAGSFMLLVDDVTFTKLDGFDGELKGYNVYRDGVKINDALVAEPSFVDTEAGAEAHTYHVTAVYDKGESELSEPVTIDQSGIDAVLAAGMKVAVEGKFIVVTGAAGKLVTINAVDGKTIHSAQGDARVAVNSAIYLVTVDRKTVKVIVR